MGKSIQRLKAVCDRLGYRFFDQGDYNLNLIGVRSRDTNSNQFNDGLIVAFVAGGRDHVFFFPCTTDPGVYYRENPANIDGTAVMKPDQYPGLWRIGLHQGKYEALVQKSLVTVYRDNNKDDELHLHYSPEATGHFGINFHRAADTGSSQRVGKWSAGCQVLANAEDFDVLMALCHKSASLYGNSFTYTLIDQDDLCYGLPGDSFEEHF